MPPVYLAGAKTAYRTNKAWNIRVTASVDTIFFHIVDPSPPPPLLYLTQSKIIVPSIWLPDYLILVNELSAHWDQVNSKSQNMEVWSIFFGEQSVYYQLIKVTIWAAWDINTLPCCLERFYVMSTNDRWDIGVGNGLSRNDLRGIGRHFTSKVILTAPREQALMFQKRKNMSFDLIEVPSRWACDHSGIISD